MAFANQFRIFMLSFLFVIKINCQEFEIEPLGPRDSNLNNLTDKTFSRNSGCTFDPIDCMNISSIIATNIQDWNTSESCYVLFEDANCSVKPLLQSDSLNLTRLQHFLSTCRGLSRWSAVTCTSYEEAALKDCFNDDSDTDNNTSHFSREELLPLWKLTELIERLDCNAKTCVEQSFHLGVGGIVTILLLTFLLILSLLMNAHLVNKYKLSSSSQQVLTKEEIKQFFNGGGDFNSTFVDGNDGGFATYNKSEFEISKSSITLLQILGRGNFGTVYSGVINRTNGGREEVAVKMSNLDCPREGLKALLSELKLFLYLGRHPHILEFKGACTAELGKGNLYILFELAEGSLQSYLREVKKPMKAMPGSGSFGEEIKNAGSGSIDYSLSSEWLETDNELSDSLIINLYRWSREIAMGMEFLASKNVVHLDLATRNVLLSKAELQAKISDLGLGSSRRMYDYQTYAKSSRHDPLPWRSIAPEALRRLEFSEKSDVWAYGVTLWEIFSLGDTPYQGLSWDVDFTTKLEKGLRLPKPDYDSHNIYSVMLRCWAINPERRPTFSELVKILHSEIIPEYVQL